MNAEAIKRPMGRAPVMRWGRGMGIALPALVMLLLPARMMAVEWSSPPGINVASQENILKERATREARSILGDHLVEVSVHIGYVRMERETPAGQGPERVKLPGFNSYIVASEGRAPEIVSEFVRVRQVFVVADRDMVGTPGALARELSASLGLDADRGDALRVITVNRPGAPALEMKAEAPDLPPDMTMTSLEELNEGLARVEPEPPPDPLKEAQSTLFLMKARSHYFSGDFQTALDQILQAIAVDPENAQAYAMLGSLYYAMNWKNLAIKYWQRSLEIDPSNREIEDLVTQIRVEEQ